MVKICPNLQDNNRKSHDLCVARKEIWRFTHSYKANKKVWLEADESVGERKEKRYNRNCD